MIVVVPLYELGINDFSKLTDAGGKRMIDDDALNGLPGLCTRVTSMTTFCMFGTTRGYSSLAIPGRWSR